MPYDINGVLLLLSALYFFWICVLSPNVAHKGIQEKKCGEAHHDDRMEFDRENHEIQKAMDQKPHSPKLDRNGPESGPPGFLHGPAGPPQLSCPKTPILGCDLKTLKTNQNIFTIF